MAGIFGIPTTDYIGTYLGMPIFTTRRTTQSYQYLVDNTQMGIEGWQAKYLSMAGQATLIKASMTSIPSYAIQTMLLPQKFSHQIDKMSCNFLWGIQINIGAVTLLNGRLSLYPKRLVGWQSHPPSIETMRFS